MRLLKVQVQRDRWRYILPVYQRRKGRGKGEEGASGGKLNSVSERYVATR